MRLSGNYEADERLLTELLRVEQNLDMVRREIVIAGRRAAMFFVDGFTKDDVVEKIMEFFFSIDAPEDAAGAGEFLRRAVPYCEAATEGSAARAAEAVLSGQLMLICEGWSEAVLMDTRTYPQREAGEPDKEKVMRGAKDGFCESVVMNLALLRRRIRLPELTCEPLVLGGASRTDIALCYIEGRADAALVCKIRERLAASDMDAPTLGVRSVAQAILGKRWLSPFPKYKVTERPDITAAQLLEGDIALLCDNTPQAMLLPVNLPDIAEDANDFYLPPLTSAYLRLTRLLMLLVTLLLTPTWLLLALQPELIPEALSFLAVSEQPAVPIAVQLIILEIALDGIRLASLNTPTMLTTTLSMLGAIVVGDFAVDSGWLLPQSMLYTAVVALVTYSQPGYELSYALKFMRMLMIITTGLFGAAGYIAGLAAALLTAALTRTLSGNAFLSFRRARARKS